jgi:hypothetical protein
MRPNCGAMQMFPNLFVNAFVFTAHKSCFLPFYIYVIVQLKYNTSKYYEGNCKVDSSDK